MRLILIRHGDAVSEETDRLRPLSREGRDEIRVLARRLKRKKVRALAIWHSDKLRAEQTAQILGEALAPGLPLTLVPELKPSADPQEVVTILEAHVLPARIQTDVLVVGHLPHLEGLLETLIEGPEGGVHGRSHRGSNRSKEDSRQAFKTGTAMCLSRRPRGGWQLKWVIEAS
jgi:phosphohistidine phosphatase SixA